MSVISKYPKRSNQAGVGKKAAAWAPLKGPRLRTSHWAHVNSLAGAAALQYYFG
ncbi:hypothetical protein M422DRAFT_243843 [Sphaerobolus stellatus SS14]|nr:hypothetical protein M422DRAFT_243843 [Sphaerobolus stellatus SS14]